MDEDFQYAINGDWDALLTAMRASRAVAQRTDASGMTVLHWVCLHQDAPTDIVVKVVFANPYAVHMRNNAGHLPIDLAVQAECGQRTLEVLRAAYNGSRREDSEDEGAMHELRGKDLDGEAATETVDYQLSYEDHTILHDGRERGPSSVYQPHQQQKYYYEEDEDEEGGVDDDELEYQHHHRHYQQPPFHSQPQHVRQPQQGAPQIQRSISNQEQERMFYESSPLHNGGMYGGYNGGGMPRNEQRLKSMELTEQRLRERENDLISVATAEDNTPLVFDPSKPPDLSLMQSFQVPEDPKGGENGNGVAPRTARTKTQFPPRWKQARTCHVCATGFSLVKRRHHCRNCGQSVCGQHSTNRVALPKFDLTEPQRICDGCFLSGHHMTAATRRAPSVAGSFHSLPAQLHHPQQDSPMQRPQPFQSSSPFQTSSPFQMPQPPYQQQPYMHAR